MPLTEQPGFSKKESRAVVDIKILKIGGIGKAWQP
jgi:hypothetical protein